MRGHRRRIGTLLVVVAAVLSVAAPAAADEVIDGALAEDHVRMAAERAQELARRNDLAPPADRLEDYERAAFCRNEGEVWDKGARDGSCPPEAVFRGTGVVTCEEGDTHLLPTWLRERETATSPWGDWYPIDNGGCGVDLLPRLAEADFRRLPLPVPSLTLQPDRGWVLVNIETIVWTDPSPVTLRTDLLGVGVTVEATPTRWEYDFGDGHSLITTRAGQPYPDHDVFHEYEDVGTVSITSTAEWTGRYQVDGNPVWRTINGTATTTATSAAFTVEERTSRLVSGLCTDIPEPPDC